MSDKHQKRGGIVDPRHVGNGGNDRLSDGHVLDDDDIALLQITLRRRRERAGAQQPQQVRLDRTRQEAAMRAI
jgi:hypothetical protein